MNFISPGDTCNTPNITMSSLDIFSSLSDSSPVRLSTLLRISFSLGVRMTFNKSSGSPHHFLAQLAGGWTGTSKLWLEPDTLTSEAPLVGNIQIILNGRFALFLYQSSIEGEPQHGMFTFGYNTTLEQYEASWVDSF